MHKPQQPKSHTLYTPKDRVIPLKSRAWQKLRAQVLAEEPLCRICMDDYNEVTPATDVDHINNDGDDNRRENLQSLCHEHHSVKTRYEMMGRKPAVVGCDENGYPLDPGHHWNGEKITGNRADEDRAPSHKHAAANGEFSGGAR